MTGPGTKEVPGPCGEPDIAPDKAHPGVKHSGREAQSVMGVPSRAVLGRALRGKQEFPDWMRREFIPGKRNSRYKTGNKTIRPVLGQGRGQERRLHKGAAGARVKGPRRAGQRG